MDGEGRKARRGQGQGGHKMKGNRHRRGRLLHKVTGREGHEQFGSCTTSTPRQRRRDPFVLDEITSKPEQLQSQSTAQMRRFICCISGAKYCGGDERKSRRASIGEMSFLLRCRRKAQSESVELALPALVPSASSDASRPAKSGIDSNKKQTNTSPTHLQPPPSPELHQRTHKALVS